MEKEKLFRNNGVLSVHEQELIGRTPVAVIGCGGTGGYVLENLVRMGISTLLLFDHDRIELTNFNRQILATDKTIDMKKTEAAHERIHSIMPHANVYEFGKMDTEAVQKLARASLVIDATDNMESRIIASEFCARAKKPYVFCSASESMGMVSVLMGTRIEKLLKVDKKNLGKYQSCVSVISPAVAIAGSLAASQGINVILKKPFVKAPNVLMFNLFKKEPFWIEKF